MVTKKKVAPHTPVGRRDYEAPRIDRRSGDDDGDKWIRSEDWVFVRSSNVLKLKYEKGIRRLLVGFRDGSIYRHEGVSVRTAKSFYFASSMGRYHWQKIRYQHPGILVEAGSRGRARVRRRKR